MIKLSELPAEDFKRYLAAISGSHKIRKSAYDMYYQVQKHEEGLLPYGTMHYKDLYDWCELKGGLLIVENSERFTATVWKTMPAIQTYSFTAPTCKMAIIRAICYALEAKYNEHKKKNPAG